ncbi:MAG: hypothetical protein ACI33K_03505 [Clostridiaceae bacterium]
MRSKLLSKRISAISLIAAMDDKEKYYIGAAYNCPMVDEFEELKEDFSYNHFMDAADHNKKIKKKLLKGNNKEIIDYIFTEVSDMDFCGLDFVLPCEMEEGDSISGIKYGLYSVILDKRIPELMEDYLENEEYEDKLAAVEDYLEDSGYDLPLAILTVIIYLIQTEEELEEIEEGLELILLDYYGQWIYEELNERLEITIKDLGDMYREKEKLVNEIKDHKEKNKALKEENNRLVKVKSQFNDILKDINKSIKAASEIYPKALKETISFKKDVSEGNFNSIITNLTLQVSDLKIVNKELKDKVKDLDSKLAVAIEKNRGLTFDLERYKEHTITVPEEPPLIEDNSTALEPKTPLKIKAAELRLHKANGSNKGKPIMVCYCEIINGVHYAVHPNGDRYEILNIRSKTYEKTYLAPGQFIKIDINGNLRHVFSQYTDKSLIGLDLVEVRYFNGDYYFRIDDEEVQINLRKGFYPENNMIFAVDKERTIRSLFSHVRSELNFYEESINAKGHKIYYALKKSGKGVYVREVFSGDESFIPGNYGEYNEGELLFFDNRGHLLHITSSSKLYTNSIYYTYGKEAVIVEQDGRRYFKLKSTGEKIKIDKGIKNLNAGDTVILDEFFNILTHLEEEKLPREFKDESKAPQEEIQYSDERIEITHKLLIVGDPAFSSNYKLNFLKKGYEAEVVDGFDSFNKISLKLKDIDCIIVISNHISHDNMWRLKDGQIPVIYPASDGANRILEDFEEFIKSKMEECS